MCGIGTQKRRILMDHLTGLSPRARSFALHMLHYLRERRPAVTVYSEGALLAAAIAHAFDQTIDEKENDR